MKLSELHFDPLAPGFLEGRQILLATEAGSRLFGVANENSDRDMRYVMLPHADELLMGQVNFGLDSNPQNLRLSDGVCDGSAYTLMRFLQLIGRLDLGAVEMLFASASPSAFLVSPVMADIYDRREALLAGTSSAAVGHARQIAGTLMPPTDAYLEAFQAAHDLVVPMQAAGHTRLSDDPAVIEALSRIAGISVFTGDTRTPRYWHELTADEQAAGRVPNATLFLQVHAKKVPTTAKLSDLLPVLEKPLRREAQRRARFEGTDVSMKDAYHAVRLMRECIELFETRSLRFPRPDAEDLSAIRDGVYDHAQLRDMLASLFEEVAAAQARAPFPEEANRDTVRDVIMRAHRSLLD